MRTAEMHRVTTETDIELYLNLDGSGAADIECDCGFLTHMLTLFAAHSGFDLKIRCRGDSEVDFHHTTEDIGITLGEALKRALGDKRGIARYASFMMPMDETLILVGLDISGRSGLFADIRLPAEKVGDFDSELCLEFLQALARSADITLHIKQLEGQNTHHIIEAVFKGLARAFRTAVKVEGDRLPSTKGVL